MASGSQKLVGTALVHLLLALPPSLHAFPTQNDHTLGTMAMRYDRRSNFWSRLDLGVVDAKTVTSPPDQAEYDRRLEGLAIVGAEGAFGSRFGLRLNVEAETTKIRRAERETPRAVTDLTVTTYKPSADLIFVTDKGLEIFGGVQVEVQNGFKIGRKLDSLSSTETYGAYQLRSNRVGVLRRTGVVSGGFYYVMGAEDEREFEKEAIDGTSLEGEETVFIPPEIGVFGEFGKGPVYDFEFNFVQGRGNGPRDENGNTIYTDYFRARLGAHFDLGGLGLKTSLAHQTLAYSHSAYIDMETIPWTSLKLLAVAGDHRANAYAGLILGYAKDGQSLPQFNAKREAFAGALSLGFFFPF